MMTLSITLYCSTSSSFRAISQIWGVLAPALGLVSVPHSETIRNWVYRFGHGSLQLATIGRRWAALIDCSTTYGDQKMRLVLGIDLDLLERKIRVHGTCRLEHSDVVVLSCEVVNENTGVSHHQELERLSAIHGAPEAVLADGGRDIQKGCRLLKQSLSERGIQLVCIYDFSHKTARILCNIMGSMPGWNEFEKFISQMRQRRDWLSKLVCPPNLKHSAERWMNFDPILRWTEAIMRCIEEGRQESLPKRYGLSESTLKQVRVKYRVWGRHLKQIQPLVGKTFDDQQSYRAAITARAKKMPEKLKQILLDAPGPDEEIWEELIEGIQEHKELIEKLGSMMHMCNSVSGILNQKGLSEESISECIENLERIDAPGEATEFREQLIEYLQGLAEQLGEDQTLIVTTDVIESIFAKVKHKIENGPRPTWGANTVTASCLTQEINERTVSEALSETNTQRLKNWVGEKFESFQSIKMRLFAKKSSQNLRELGVAQ